MKVSAEQFKTIKDAPNSCYELIKPEFLFHSNKLEGSTFSEDELAKLLNEGKVSGEHDLDDVLETIGSANVFDYMVDTLSEPVSETMLFDMSRMLFEGTEKEARGFTGHYKEIPNRIRGSRIETALPGDVPAAMDGLIGKMNEPAGFEEIARIHARFEHIHPFQDGNGRIGRFLMFRQSILNGIDLMCIDSEFEHDYKTWLEIAQADGDFRFYYDALRKCQARFGSKMEAAGVARMLPSAESARTYCASVGWHPYASARKDDRDSLERIDSITERVSNHARAGRTRTEDCKRRRPDGR